MGMNPAGDGMVAIDKDTAERMRQAVAEDNLHEASEIARKIGLGVPTTILSVGELVEFKGHRWEIRDVSTDRLTLIPRGRCEADDGN